MARILIVDDDPDVVEACRLCLDREGHEIASAKNCEDGLRSIRQAPPDLLLLDIMMDEPDDGIALAQTLRREGFDRPILMMSSISRATGFSYGRDDAIVPVDDFAEKPLSPAKLIEKVTQLLAKNQENG